MTTPTEPPSKMMTPLRSVTELASITPVLLTTVAIKSPALRAPKITLPPSAWIKPRFSAKAFTAALSILKLSRPSPLISKLTLSPAANATVPKRAEIKPWLITSGASNATKPPLAALILPWFTTEPALPFFSKM